MTDNQKDKYEEAAKEYVKGSEKIKQLAAKNGFMAGAEHSHPIAHSEGWNEAIDAVEELMTDGGWLYDRDGNVLLGLIQKLRK